MKTSTAPAPAETGTTQNTILPAMEKIDPFLRFLTKATGKTSVPLKLLQQVLPKTNADDTATTNQAGEETNDILLELTHRGVLQYEPNKQTIGFPLPPSPTNDSSQFEKSSDADDSMLQKPPSKLIGKGLHGSSETAAKRRMKVLKWTLERVPTWICRNESTKDNTKKANSATTSDKPKARGNSKKKTNKSKNDSEASKESATTSNKKRARGNNTEKETIDEVAKDQPHQEQDGVAETDERFDECDERRAAYQALDALLRGSGKSLNERDDATIDSSDPKRTAKQWLPCQAAYAGSHPGRVARYETLSKETLAKIPSEILQLFDLDLDGSRLKDDSMPRGQKRLFLHQANAIESAMNNVHTVVQTATGSGKSFCFLLPVLAKAMRSLQQQQTQGETSNAGSAAILLFPTKALAQDQYSKINALLQKLPNNNNPNSLRAGVIDGDTPHQLRDDIATTCQIILTNPDTLHAGMLPNWKKRPAYQKLLARVATVVVDEAHVYEGAFGAHVAMVLARLKRVCRVASSPSNADNAPSSAVASISPLFIACSATMIHPEEHFRLLCPIGKEEKVCVLTSKEDGSPCAPKHFFVFNPPILDVSECQCSETAVCKPYGNSTESVFLPKPPKGKNGHDEEGGDTRKDGDPDKNEVAFIPIGSRKKRRKRNFSDDARNAPPHHHSNLFTRRRHAADETAFLLAKAISTGVRTIAFCKTRSLVEWVYGSTLAILQSNPDTSHLTSKVESYRGGYTKEARRSIEERLFQGKLCGVVGTNALELGVDVGGVDLTLHTGYPGTISSLLQQSGRAGRGKGSDIPSCSIMVCFSSPSEQYIWKNPTSLLSKGVDAPPTLPINGTVMQGHLLCAGEEFPLCGDRPVSCLLNEFGVKKSCPADAELLGSILYQDNIQFLLDKGLLSQKTVSVVSGTFLGVEKVAVYSTHPVVKSPWKRVSLRSIEPLSYSIVDLSHNLQGGKTDKIHNQAAVMDTIPYSRVFYHAFPGAIIMHRGRKYRIESMESPPPFVGGASFGPCGCSNLIAFAKPTSLQYSTQALSINQITVVKQMGHAESRVTHKRDTPQISADDRKKHEHEESKSQSNEESVVTGTVAGHANEESVVTATVAGHGVVTVKRTVHGYKKLSHVNRKELSRTVITLPPMEYDTYALWIDADAAYLRDVIFDFDGGVHALSHALVAVAPLFVSCTSSDIDCDHSRHDTTRILLYDQRAGGSGVTAQLYGFIVEALQAAVNLLEECTSCYSVKGYDGGCPACLQSVPCDNFHQDLSRSAGTRVGNHLIKRLRSSNLNPQKKTTRGDNELEDGVSAKNNHVQSKLSSDNDMQSSIKPKNIVIGRATWMDSKDRTRWAEADE
ncbi:hypothetical protein ACHAXR_013351 [Thalassiosira sp. AJA248-18]